MSTPFLRSRSLGCRDLDAVTTLEGGDDRVSELKSSEPVASMDRRRIACSQRVQEHINVLVESAVELAIAIVEVAGLPYRPRLVARLGQRQPLDGVFDNGTANRAVELEQVSGGICV